VSQQINLYEARLRPRHELATGRNLGIGVLALLVLTTTLSLWVRSEANRKSAAALASQQQSGRGTGETDGADQSCLRSDRSRRD
jgi:hypothetical protein